MLSFIHNLTSDLRTSSRTTIDVWDNLHLFLQDSTPPNLTFAPNPTYLRLCDWEPVTDPHPLYVEPNSIRKLKGVQIAPRLMKHLPLKFCDKYIPRTENGLTANHLPSSSRFEGLLSAQFNSTTDPKYGKNIKVSTTEEMCKAMSPTMIAAETALSMVWPEETKDHAFIKIRILQLPGHSELCDEMLCKVMSYRKKTDKHSLEASHKLMIFCFAAWGLSSDDFHGFLSVDEDFPMQIIGEPKLQYNKGQRVWVKLWDMCAQRRCPFFVVTNNESWVFGWFLTGWTKATVSSIVKREDKSPSVLQCLTYWLASAMEIEGALRRPIKGHSARSGNPDINDNKKITGEEPEYVAHSDWLEDYHVVELASNSTFVTSAHPDMLNTWVTAPKGTHA